MNHRRLSHFTKAFCFVVPLFGVSVCAQITAGDPGWPRHYSNGAADLAVYQPQVDAWSDFKVLTGRCAFALTPARGHDPVYGTFRFAADTLADTNQRLVLLRNVRAFNMRFPSAPGGSSEPWSELARQLLPSDAVVISLDRVLAFVKAGSVPRQEAHVRTEPPAIFASMRPAVLVILDGDPVMLDVDNTGMRRILNTNWDLFQDRRSNFYYLRVKKTWLKTADLYGTFTPATDAPPDLARLVTDESKESAVSMPAAPRVIVVNKPSELIVTEGSPAFTPIARTQLFSITNTESDLFFYGGDRCYYFLTSGRWFRAPNLNGPWQYASAALPEDFREVPPDHPRAHVLAAVAGTREADDAVLLAAIPRTAEVKRSEAKAETQYVGAPEFVPIAGTAITYARNTPNDVLRIGDLYYLCFQGVWFVSSGPNGPWQAADKVPQEIYSVPESSPKYHVTYVRIYESTPDTIVVGYTPGYYGAYVSGGVVVWGTGYYYPPYVAAGVAPVPVYWGAAYHTYGASAWYNPATGVYARGSAVYGPNGGTYSAGYNATNPYGSWGQGAVGNGSNWARGGYESTSRGAIAAGETSKGGRGVAVEGANGREGYLAKSAGGDVYAGANGNVYKRDNGQWYQNQNGSWSAIDKGELGAQREQGAARDLGNRNAQMGERWRQNSGAGQRPGFEQRPQFQRPQFQGRRR